ncbi:MAG: hypothetical protein Q8920_16120 [Bacillota bacterium]|nr:hypothetical protein [Bacillota bacterium]
MDKLDLILEKLNQIDTMTEEVKKINNKIDNMQADVLAIKADNKKVNGKLDKVIDIIAGMKEDITEINMVLIDKNVKAIK